MDLKIQYCSDLHLEFRENNNYMREHPLEPVGTILILAGDVVTFAEMNKRVDFFSYVSDHFEQVYWVPGNHEYYQGDITRGQGALCEKVRENVWLVNNTAFVHGDIRLVCSTETGRNMQRYLPYVKRIAPKNIDL